MDAVYMVKSYLTHNWWSNLELRDVNNWLDNFGTDIEIGKHILKQIVFYNDDQLESYTKSIIDQIKAEVYLKSFPDLNQKIKDTDLERCWQEYLNHMRVVPADCKVTAGGSPHLVVRKYRRILGNAHTSKIENIGQDIANGISNFLLVDDFSGTGEQMRELLSSKVQIDGKDIVIGDIPTEYENVNITIAVYVIHKKALKSISHDFQHIKIKYIDLIDERWDLLNIHAYAYNGMKEKEAQFVIDYLKKKCDELREERAEYQNLEKYQLNIPIVFAHGCPNNAFLLLYAGTNSWKQLFKRGDEQ